MWHANTVIVGAHVDSEEDLKFKRCTFRLSGLIEWLTEPWNGQSFFELPPARSCGDDGSGAINAREHGERDHD